MDPHYPMIEIDSKAIENNARVLCGLCRQNGISVAGVIKFSDGRVPIARSYAAGGCVQIGVSRASHLRALREALPGTELMLTRAPGPSDTEEAARFADLILHSSADGLRALDAAAANAGTRPGVLLMRDLGDLREGVETTEELCALAGMVERELPHLRLRGVGAALACLNGILPTPENLAELSDAAEAAERTIGRPLELISGGSSIDLLLLKDGISRIPPRINHLRLGGSIANPRNIRLNRGVTFPGLREDTMLLRAEIIEILEKDSRPRGVSTLNWAGSGITQREDRGRRLRAILALGSQDVGDATKLTPLDEGVEILGCSSDHTVVDVTDYPGTLAYGDTLSFAMGYSAMLYALSGKHVAVRYTNDCRCAGESQG